MPQRAARRRAAVRVRATGVEAAASEPVDSSGPVSNPRFLPALCDEPALTPTSRMFGQNALLPQTQQWLLVAHLCSTEASRRRDVRRSEPVWRLTALDRFLSHLPCDCVWLAASGCGEGGGSVKGARAENPFGFPAIFTFPSLVVWGAPE